MATCTGRAADVFPIDRLGGKLKRFSAWKQRRGHVRQDPRTRGLVQAAVSVRAAKVPHRQSGRGVRRSRQLRKIAIVFLSTSADGLNSAPQIVSSPVFGVR